jgi:hypothetical protein
MAGLAPAMRVLGLANAQNLGTRDTAHGTILFLAAGPSQNGMARPKEGAAMRAVRPSRRRFAPPQDDVSM